MASLPLPLWILLACILKLISFNGYGLWPCAYVNRRWAQLCQNGKTLSSSAVTGFWPHEKMILVFESTLLNSVLKLKCDWTHEFYGEHTSVLLKFIYALCSTPYFLVKRNRRLFTLSVYLNLLPWGWITTQGPHVTSAQTVSNMEVVKPGCGPVQYTGGMASKALIYRPILVGEIVTVTR